MREKLHIGSILFSFVLFITLFSGLPAASHNIVVRPIPSLDKLPVNAIHRIFQDSEGYMWYGTFNGLCRYDGYNIRVFRSDLFHPDLLSDNYITYIVEDVFCRCEIRDSDNLLFKPHGNRFFRGYLRADTK